MPRFKTSFKVRHLVAVWLLCNAVAGHIYAKFHLHNIANSEYPIETYADSYSFQFLAYAFVFGIPSLFALLVAVGVYVRSTSPR